MKGRILIAACVLWGVSGLGFAQTVNVYLHKYYASLDNQVGKKPSGQKSHESG